ncbi:hypothetical protein AMTRI_Chr07g28760 [Amborella trichopoda]
MKKLLIMRLWRRACGVWKKWKWMREKVEERDLQENGKGEKKGLFQKFKDCFANIFQKFKDSFKNMLVWINAYIPFSCIFCLSFYFPFLCSRLSSSKPISLSRVI